MVCLSKYLSNTFETLKAETARHYAKHFLRKIGYHSDDVDPRPFNRYHEMKHNSAIICQNQLEFWNQGQNRVSHSSLKSLVLKLKVLVPDPLL